MEEKLKNLTCKKCGTEKPESEFIITWYARHYRQLNLEDKTVTCKECHNTAKRNSDYNWREKEPDKYKDYQKQYHALRKQNNIYINIYDLLLASFRKRKQELEIPEQIWSEKEKKFVESFLSLEKKDDFYSFCKKNNIQKPLDLVAKFDKNYKNLYNFLVKEFDLKVVTREEIYKKRLRKTIDLLQKEEIKSLQIDNIIDDVQEISQKDWIKGIMSDSDHTKSVIATYIYFSYSRNVTDKKLMSWLLSPEMIQVSKMFMYRNTTYNGKKYTYIYTSNFAKKFIIKKFRITLKNQTQSELIVKQYLESYLFKKVKNQKLAEHYLGELMQGYKRIVYDLMAMNLKNNLK